MSKQTYPWIGNCYAACEALYHLLGGKQAGWKPMYIRMPEMGRGFTHWFLKHESGIIMDPTKKQFRNRPVDYSRGIGSGFLTKKPSRRAKALMDDIVYIQKPKRRK